MVNIVEEGIQYRPIQEVGGRREGLVRILEETKFEWQLLIFIEVKITDPRFKLPGFKFKILALLHII